MNTETLPDPGPEPGGIDVEVSDTQSHLRIEPEALSRLVRGALRAEGVGLASISVAVVDDATIRAINRRHLDHDWPTDVISFGLSEPGDGGGLSGELVVSAETAAATARRAGVSPWDELALYLVHGLLHLCGHDDSDDGGRDAMRRREGEILARLGLSNTFPAATGAGGRESARWTV
ncbi:MAG: rRNA maturation RNase YbeY [Planctomycetia bacterium]|nr:rRNA maturation RNase YbeY [Planctomycetia bacterium]